MRKLFHVKHLHQANNYSFKQGIPYLLSFMGDTDGKICACLLHGWLLIEATCADWKVFGGIL